MSQRVRMEGLRSLVAGVVLALCAVAVYLVPALSEHALELQGSASTLAQWLAGASAAAFGVGKLAEALKYRGGER